LDCPFCQPTKTRFCIGEEPSNFKSAESSTAVNNFVNNFLLHFGADRGKLSVRDEQLVIQIPASRSLCRGWDCSLSRIRLRIGQSHLSARRAFFISKFDAEAGIRTQATRLTGRKGYSQRNRLPALLIQNQNADNPKRL